MKQQHLATDQQQTKTPSEAYLQLSKESSVFTLQQPKKQLLILDLNGTLISRIKIGNKSGKDYYVRPHYQRFQDYIFKHFDVMVWSSARLPNVNRMCNIFTKPLKLVWCRSQLELTQQEFNSNTDTVKDLNIVWKHFSNEYNARNTIVLDDTPTKLAYQPYNLIHIRTFCHEDIHEGYTDNELLKVIPYLDTLRHQSNVANFARYEPFLSHRYSVPDDVILDSAMGHFARGRMSAAPYQPPKRGNKTRFDEDGNMVANTNHQDIVQDTSVKAEPDDVGNYINTELQPEDDINAKQEEEDKETEEPSRKKRKRTKREKPPRHLRKPRHKKQKKQAIKEKTAAAAMVPLRPQTEEKLKSIQESIKQRKKMKKERDSFSSIAIKVEP
ncbi:hypothetical protein PS15m_003220 [Mucor circinelloides]